jgi:hypothetical protein
VRKGGVALRRLFAHALLAGALAVLLLPLAKLAWAQPPPPLPQRAVVEVMVLHATQNAAGGSIGPGIGNMPQLQQPPFSAFNTYRLLAKQSLTLQKGVPMTYTLPNGRVLQVTLSNVLAGPRYEISAAINQPGSNAYLNLLRVTTPPNQTFFVAGQQFQGGVIIIGFTLH